MIVGPTVGLFVGTIFAFFSGMSVFPSDGRLSDIDVLPLEFVSTDMDFVTGTLSKSASVTRTLVGVVFFGIRFNIGFVDEVTLLVFSITFGFTVAVGLLTTLVDDCVESGNVGFLTTGGFRSSKSL